ncbi:hypothetical protein CA54_58690 [Symmachiella macrocystis]|uniref:Uncharacterized protein n=1 Tax=Symmachiella macrocystis TaxID=2527985 RepID=A0A5C6B0T2_9PLAN|nr:hypothetical protein CA54_58690 [Symmachiella macrocystis]
MLRPTHISIPTLVRVKDEPLLSDGSTHAFFSHPEFDLERPRLFATALMLNAVAEDPFSRSEWLQAVRIAPAMKPGYYTVQ